MVRLRSVDVVSCAKMYGILHMALGVLVALVLVLIGLVGFAAAPGQQKFGMIGVLVFAAFSPFLYGLFGFIAGAVMAQLYNWVASAIGGVKMELETIPESFLVPPSSAPTPQVAG